MICSERMLKVLNMKFCNQRGKFSTLNLRFAYFVQNKKPVYGVVMFPGMSNTRLKMKILIILDFENSFLSTYLQLCGGLLYITLFISPWGYLRLYIAFSRDHRS